ncbi:hypothetical protein BDN71DRAFT_1430376 [Pleurotus eryngii]|uniref:Uncharacterized protein n=1 Tax=Pleurotus eryngii TaxID=5323 RepID=A0A9P6A048_PLEER|nr:hypothetical protein BDN71DRAFT_1430376 [Pleurotus eryngii]
MGHSDKIREGEGGGRRRSSLHIEERREDGRRGVYAQILESGAYLEFAFVVYGVFPARKTTTPPSLPLSFLVPLPSTERTTKDPPPSPYPSVPCPGHSAPPKWERGCTNAREAARPLDLDVEDLSVRNSGHRVDTACWRCSGNCERRREIENAEALGAGERLGGQAEEEPLRLTFG